MVAADRVHVMDLRSSSGTRVNGARLPAGEWFELRIGDRVEFADDVFVLRREGVEQEQANWEPTLAMPSLF